MVAIEEERKILLDITEAYYMESLERKTFIYTKRYYSVMHKDRGVRKSE